MQLNPAIRVLIEAPQLIHFASGVKAEIHGRKLHARMQHASPRASRLAASFMLLMALNGGMRTCERIQATIASRSLLPAPQTMKACVHRGNAGAIRLASSRALKGSAESCGGLGAMTKAALAARHLPRAESRLGRIPELPSD